MSYYRGILTESFRCSVALDLPDRSQCIERIDLSTARPKWRLDGPALSGHLLYSLVNHGNANLYHHHLVR